MAIDYKKKGPFANTGNQTNTKEHVFYNFGLPAVGTCPNAPGACKTLVEKVKNKKNWILTLPVCFAVRPVTNYHFEEKTAKAHAKKPNKQGGINYKSNPIYQQYANLFLSFDKNKTTFMNWLQTQLCKDMTSSFTMYFNQINKLKQKKTNAYDPKGQMFLGYNSKNIWQMLELHFTGRISNGTDFLANKNKKPANGNRIFVNYMIKEINSIIDKKCSGNVKLDIYIRIHYSGDFYSEDYFKKWVDITDCFSQDKRIHFMAYTKEIENIEQWLKNMKRNLQGGSNGINIKLVFSEMSGFGPCNDTSLTAMDAYNRLNKFQPCMKYTAAPNIPKGYSGNVCYLTCGNGCMRCYDEKSTNDVLVKIF